MGTTHTFNRNGVKIAYDDSDPAGRAGPVVVCLHAFPVDRRMYAAQAALPARVLAFDTRGFGESGPVSDILDVDTVAGDVVTLLDHAGIERAVLVGTSMGGYQAMAVARRDPDRLAGLVFIDTRAQADTDQQRNGRLETIETILEGGIAALADAMVPMLLAESTREGQPEVQARVRGWIVDQPVDAAAAALRGLAQRPDATAGLRDVVVPTAVVHGEQDRIAGVEISRDIAALVPGATLDVIPGCGHLPPVEAPEATNAVIKDLLDRL